MEWDQWANVIASGLVATTALAFALGYSILAPWRRSEIGRHLMEVTGAIGLLGLYTVLVTVWPRGPAAMGLRVARVVLLVTLAGLLVQRTRLMIRAQRRPPDATGRELGGGG